MAILILRGKLVQISDQEVAEDGKKCSANLIKQNSRMTSFNYADPLPSSRGLNNKDSRTMTYQRSSIDCVV